MTIVIQHRFWDLKVEDDGFSVGLSFGGVPATLVVPFAAITDFVDPAVDFSLQVPGQWRDGAGPRSMTRRRMTSPAAEPAEDGSNVVSVDFTRKK